jgi:hypothetical protein
MTGSCRYRDHAAVAIRALRDDGGTRASGRSGVTVGARAEYARVGRHIVGELRLAATVAVLAAGAETALERGRLVVVDHDGYDHRKRHDHQCDDEDCHLLHCQLGPLSLFELAGRWMTVKKKP